MQCNAVQCSAVQCSAAQCSSAVQCSAVQCSAVQCSAVHAMQCSAVQCSAVQCSAVQCSAVQCNAVQCSAVQYSAVQCSAVQCSAIQYNTIQYIQYSAMRCDAMRCDAMRYDTIRYTTIQCNATMIAIPLFKLVVLLFLSGYSLICWLMCLTIVLLNLARVRSLFRIQFPTTLERSSSRIIDAMSITRYSSEPTGLFYHLTRMRKVILLLTKGLLLSRKNPGRLFQYGKQIMASMV